MQHPFISHGVLLAMLVASVQPVWAGKDCDAPPESWQPRSALNALAQRNGWRVDKLKIDDGCYEVKGHDAAGRRFKARIDPATLEVLRVKREHGERERDQERERERRGGPAPQTPSGSAPVADSLAPAAAPRAS